jgi:NO-binding membrane sensor protein with MHYT domain
MLNCITDFFQYGAIPLDSYSGVYDMRLVALSYMVAVFASYIALDLTGRLRDHNNTKASSLLWLVGGSIAMGAGIWSMHFIGMLSFKITGLNFEYDIYWTGFSLIVAILASLFALFLLKRSVINIVHLIAGGIILGLAIASMHYTGMEGMLITLNIRYLPGLFLLSIIVAIVASEAAIWLALKSNTVIMRLRNRIKFASALVMGVAICGMHYTGMAASVFTPLCTPALTSGTSLDPTILAMSIATVTFMILSIALFASSYKEAINQQQFEHARQLGMAEISASVLHNVGNVLNSVNVSANTLSEQLNTSKINNLEKLVNLLKSHQNDLANFLTTDAQGKKVIDYIDNLSSHQQSEQKKYTDEVNIIIKNISTIRDIISTQQTLSKSAGFESIIIVNELLDECLLITGVELNEQITTVKNYEKFSPVLIDKVKLLQVLINLIRNAKDALLESSNKTKVLTLKSYVRENFIFIEIQDSGIGISPTNLSKIFYYGFTTKRAGHGFGLHTCALVINELGGEISVTSDGVEKGTTFILKLPYIQPK